MRLETLLNINHLELFLKFLILFLKKSFSDDEVIAFVKFPLPNSLFDGIFLDEWIPLSGKLGENKEGYINIQMLFTVYCRLI